MTEPIAFGRPFVVQRDKDISGVSGTGIIADGIVFPDGQAAIHWRGRWALTTPHPDGMESIIAIHDHGGRGDLHIIWPDESTVPVASHLEAAELAQKEIQELRAAVGRASALAVRWQGAHGSSAFLVRTAGAELSDELNGMEPTGIRGLLEHVGIDTRGRDITVAGRVVDAAQLPPNQGPLTGIEVRDPCPYCGDRQMIPRHQFAEHVARLHPDVREGGPGIPVPAAEPAAEVTVRLDNFAATFTPCSAVDARSGGDEAELREQYAKAIGAFVSHPADAPLLDAILAVHQRTTAELRREVETADRIRAEAQRDRDQDAAVLREVLATFDRVASVPDGRTLGHQGKAIDPEMFERWRSVVAPTVERPWWEQLAEARATIGRVRALLPTESCPTRGLPNELARAEGYHGAYEEVRYALDGDTREATEACPYCTGGPMFPRSVLGAHIEQTHARVLAALARGVSLDELLHEAEVPCQLPHEMEA